jgi:UDP-N-acetylglucosamine--N-acetylmuramyl-(pentapeptide) pyrophosphoryl-undecaprenol N-acetylglucosamine transferase
MGGFVSGPGGIATKIMGRHLLIHEQNAVAGVTNKILARFADCVFEAFPHTFKPSAKVVHTGNPVREDIVALDRVIDTESLAQRPLRLLVLGGSQGALAINTVIPEVLAQWKLPNRPEIWHQTGNNGLEQTRAHYKDRGLEFSASCRVEPFIEDMARAYGWADLVICRAGASTVSELAVAGLPSVLIPYPHHADRQQLFNAQWLANANAAFIIEQSELSAAVLSRILSDLNSDRDELSSMSQRAKSLAICNASDWIAERCLEVANG